MDKGYMVLFANGRVGIDWSVKQSACNHARIMVEQGKDVRKNRPVAIVKCTLKQKP